MNLNDKIIKPKLGLLELAKQLGSVSSACKAMGYSRDSYYRFKELYEVGGHEALYEISRKKPIMANRVDTGVEKAVIEMAIEYPAYGQLRVSNELKKEGVLISPGGVRSVWLRNDLNNLKKRLKALEAKVAQDGIILTESQLTALERQKAEKESHGEIETEHSGYLGSQDIYYVGNFKGIGRVYQQTFIDTYDRVAHAKLYTDKTAITSADLLNDRVLPWYEQQGVPLLRILTDRGHTSTGWFYGMKLHMLFNTKGEIVRLTVTPGNCDDRAPVPGMLNGLKVKLIGDKGYISQKLFDDLFSTGTTLITKVRKNMKNRFMSMADKFMLAHRSFIETIFSSLKSLGTLIHHRHRCPINAFAHLLAGLISYQLRNDKPILDHP